MFPKPNQPLPRRLRPDPIIDSSVEIRFNPLVDKNAVFGIIYLALKEKFPLVEQLPVMQLPEAIREQDPLFSSKAHYRLVGENYSVQIGSHVLSVHGHGEYQGWSNYSQIIFEIFEKIKDYKVIDEVTRLGVRYLSFFDSNIFEGIKMNLSIPGYSLPTYPATVRLEIPSDDFIRVLQIVNNVTIIQDNTPKIGSIIDIDTVSANAIPDFFNNMSTLIEQAHQLEKELFYGLLEEHFLATLKPEY